LYFLLSFDLSAQKDSSGVIPVQQIPDHIKLPDNIKVPVKVPVTLPGKQPAAQSPANLRHILVLPIIGRSIETGWSFGVVCASTFHLNAHDSATRTSNAQAVALYTTRNQFVAALNGSIYFPGERFILNEQLSYSSFPDNFWGLGKAAPDSNKESYKFKQYYVYLHPQRRIGSNLFLGVVFEHQGVFDVEYEKGGVFDQQDIVGRYGYHITGLGLSFTYDTRNNAFSPSKGTMMQFWFDHFMPFLGSDYQYTSYTIDIRRFIRVHKEQVLALQAYGMFTAGEVPLRSLAALGGASSMRGYYAGRYRDKNQGVVQAEYRVPIVGRFGAVGFAGFGNVVPELKDINFQDLKYSFGGGVRIALNKSEKLNLRLDYGFGKSSQGFYLQLGEAF
jgi:outer membrane protein assembly factor BamA